MKTLQLRAFYNEKMYEVSNIDLLGTIRYVTLLDIYNGDDGECPLIKVQITSKIDIMMASHNVDKNGRPIYDDDIVRTNTGHILPITFNDESDYFQIGGYSYAKAWDLNCDTVLDLELEIIGNINENRELIF